MTTTPSPDVAKAQQPEEPGAPSDYELRTVALDAGASGATERRALYDHGFARGEQHGLRRAVAVMRELAETNPSPVDLPASEPSEGSMLMSNEDVSDSDRLELLRAAIDDHLGWASEESEEAGDYVARVVEVGAERNLLLTERRKRELKASEPSEPVAIDELVRISNERHLLRAALRDRVAELEELRGWIAKVETAWRSELLAQLQSFDAGAAYAVAALWERQPAAPKPEEKPCAKCNGCGSKNIRFDPLGFGCAHCVACGRDDCTRPLSKGTGTQPTATNQGETNAPRNPESEADSHQHRDARPDGGQGSTQGVTEDLTDWLAKNPKLVALLRDIRARRRPEPKY